MKVYLSLLIDLLQPAASELPPVQRLVVFNSTSSTSTRLPPCVTLCSSWQQDLSPCCSLLGANRFCQPSSQRPCSGPVTVPSLQRGWRGLDGHTRSWGGGGLAGGHGANRVGGGGRFGWGDGWMDARAATCIRSDPPPPTAHRQPQTQIIQRRA